MMNFIAEWLAAPVNIQYIDEEGNDSTYDVRCCGLQSTADYVDMIHDMEKDSRY